jgi:uncharacterized repeat protein (TIGR01451 family)
MALAMGDVVAQTCAAPGRDGPGTLTGTVNSFYVPANGTYGSGLTSIPLTRSNVGPPAITPGDLVLVIQMQCADIDAGDSATYGSYTFAASCQAGRHEYARALTGSSDSLVQVNLSASYVQAAPSSASTNVTNRRVFQVVRVPQYSTAAVSGTVTAPAWDGLSGGVVAIDVTGDLYWTGGTIDVSGRGFRGGGGQNRGASNPTTVATGAIDPAFPSGTGFRTPGTASGFAQKGEGISGTPRFVTIGPNAAFDLGSEGYANGDYSRGAPANAGGGGADINNGARDNGGGGGGGNGGTGGRGGYGWRGAGWANISSSYTSTVAPVGAAIIDLRGFGGRTFAQRGVAQLVLGGGGGAGGNNGNTAAGQTSAASGGASGGGLVLVRAGRITGVGTINADGSAATDYAGNDGAGGGGAGGSVSVLAEQGGVGTLTVNARGGRGGNSFATGNVAHAGGGGGGGGVVVLSGGASVSVTGGANGVTTTADNPPGGAAHGASAGADGVVLTGVALSSAPGPAGARCLPSLTVSKSTSTPVRVSGQDSTASYTITVSNAANLGDASGVNVLDVLPVPFTYTAGSPSGNATVSVSGGASPAASPINGSGSGTAASPLSFGSFTLPGGSSLSISFPINLNSAALGLYQNPASVTYLDPTRISATQTVTPGGSYAIGGTVGGSNYASASSTAEDVRIEGRANLSVSKDDGKSVTSPGATNVYSIVVTNNGPSDASGSRITDAAVAGLSCTAVSCTANNANAACPVAGTGAGQLSVANLQNTAAGGGVQIPTLRNGGQLTLSLTCTVTASGL